MDNSATAPDAAPATNPRRKKILLLLIVVFLLAGIAYGIYWWLNARNYESTDDAYVQGNVIQITPQVAGTVIAITANDTDFVKAGQTLVKLDPTDAQVALEQARAQLAQAVREVRTLYVNNGSLKAAVSLREADAAKAATDVARAQADVARRRSLVSTGAVSKEEMQHAQDALAAARSAETAARAAVAAAREQLASNQSLTQGISVAEHPSVQRAAARFKETYVNYKRIELPAPVSGYVARRSVQVGQRIAPGTPLMAIVPLDQLWVDANFKEVQLRDMRIGQPVTLTADVYGKDVVYHGTVEGMGAGTGSAFALLPAQNATGNWIKVVQRVPVRIKLDPKELDAHPLRVGLSMLVEVDIRDQSGKMLSSVPNPAPHSATQVFARDDSEADALVARIIADNIGRQAQARPAVHKGMPARPVVNSAAVRKPAA